MTQWKLNPLLTPISMAQIADNRRNETVRGVINSPKQLLRLVRHEASLYFPPEEAEDVVDGVMAILRQAPTTSELLSEYSKQLCWLELMVEGSEKAREALSGMPIARVLHNLNKSDEALLRGAAQTTSHRLALVLPTIIRGVLTRLQLPGGWDHYECYYDAANVLLHADGSECCPTARELLSVWMTPDVAVKLRRFYSSNCLAMLSAHMVPDLLGEDGWEITLFAQMRNVASAHSSGVDE